MSYTRCSKCLDLSVLFFLAPSSTTPAKQLFYMAHLGGAKISFTFSQNLEGARIFSTWRQDYRDNLTDYLTIGAGKQ
jgi:hypothetical protein